MQFLGTHSDYPPRRVVRLELIADTSSEEIWLTRLIDNLRSGNTAALAIELNEPEIAYRLELSDIRDNNQEDPTGLDSTPY